MSFGAYILPDSNNGDTELTLVCLSLPRLGVKLITGIPAFLNSYVSGNRYRLPLTYELRKAGIPVINFTPSRGNDKHTRVNSVSPLFESGRIYAPKDMEFAQEVIEECAAFPFGDVYRRLQMEMQRTLQ